MIIICDSSPVVALAICGKLDLLNQLFDEVFIPGCVYRELACTDKPESSLITLWAKGKVVEVEDRYLVQAFSATLDEGESEAMALYCEKKADFLLIDEKKGRKIAAYNGLKVIGTLGILLLSKRKGFLPAIKPAVDLLQQSNIRISGELYRKALELAME